MNKEQLKAGGTMIPESMKDWIDNASYESLLSRWRSAPIGSPWFQGEVGEYYSQKMREKRSEVGDSEHIRASKAIGWDNAYQ